MSVTTANITILTGEWEPDRIGNIDQTKRFLEGVGHLVQVYQGFNAAKLGINSTGRLGRGHVGCILSSMAIMASSMKLQSEWAGIFESDAIMSCSPLVYKEVLKKAPDVDALWLYATDASWYDHKYERVVFDGKRYYLVDQCWWHLPDPINTTAMFYNRKARECILKHMHLDLPLDRMISDVMKKCGLKWAVSDLVDHGNFGSMTAIDSGR